MVPPRPASGRSTTLPEPVARLYGVDLASDHPLGSQLDRPRGGEALSFTCDDTAPSGEADAEIAAARVLYESPFRVEGENACRLLLTARGREVLRFGPFLDFWLDDRRVECFLRSPAHRYLVEIRLLGPVLAYWLERQGVLALHAAAVVVDGQAIAFVSGNRGGKSSLAAHCLQRGAALLTDDILPVETAVAEGVTARPGYPQMRLWPRQAEQFVGTVERLEPVHPRYAKLRVPIGEGGFGRFHPDRCPLSAIYLVEPAEESAGEPAVIEPLSPHAAVFELARHSFVGRLLAAAGRDRVRLASLARLIDRVPVRRLRWGGGEAGLEAARMAVTGESARRGGPAG